MILGLWCAVYGLERYVRFYGSVKEMERSLQKAHVRRLSKGKCSAQAGIVYTDKVTGLERVADHTTNIAFSILDTDPEQDFEV